MVSSSVVESRIWRTFAAALTLLALGAGTAQAADGVRPGLKSASVNGTALVLTFDEPLDTGSAAPAGSAFTVKARR